MVIAGCRARRPVARPEAYQPDRRGLSEDTTPPCARQCLKSEVPKLHYAIHRQTAAELIKHRADSSVKNMGLTSWEGSPDGKILKPMYRLPRTIYPKKNWNHWGVSSALILTLPKTAQNAKSP